MLDDGSYDAMVIDAEEVASPGEAALSIELTIVAGAHKGEVVTVSARHLDRDPLDLLGVPATLTVDDGRPSVRLEG